jgi:predicted TIM-barrel fold metal-dependent hydrolase
MTHIVDFHVHIFEDNLRKWLSKVPLGPLSPTKLDQFRKQARTWMRPLAGSLHGLQTTLRYLPKTARRSLDELSALVPLPNLLVESTVSDLMEAMDGAGVHSALVIAHPPVISNEFILEVCQQEPRLIPVVNIPKNLSKPGNVLKNYVTKGAKVLKIHAAADGEGPESPRYRSLIKTASGLGLPIIIHTGCMHSSLLYKNPIHGRAESFMKWYKSYPETTFILAHMNFHEPHRALDICEEFPNVYVDTSWQPTEIIGEAVRRIGAEKVLFGTDWPLLGNNIDVGLKRIQECVETGLLNADQSKLILGENAVKLLGLSVNANRTQ